VRPEASPGLAIVQVGATYRLNWFLIKLTSYMNQVKKSLKAKKGLTNAVKFKIVAHTRFSCKNHTRREAGTESHGSHEDSRVAWERRLGFFA
jgi:hypothetical protein